MMQQEVCPDMQKRGADEYEHDQHDLARQHIGHQQAPEAQSEEGEIYWDRVQQNLERRPWLLPIAIVKHLASAGSPQSFDNEHRPNIGIRHQRAHQTSQRECSVPGPGEDSGPDKKMGLG